MICSIGDDDQEEEDEEGDEEGGSKSNGSRPPTKPGCCDYFMHFLAVPWKLIFALIPPTGLSLCKKKKKGLFFLRKRKLAVKDVE